MDRNIRPDEIRDDEIRNTDGSRRIDPLATPEELQPDMMMPETSPDELAGENRADGDYAVPKNFHRGDEHGPLLSPQETGDLRTQWDIIQTGFVDEPRHAVEQADQLVAQALDRLTATFRAERTRLEAEWDRTGDVSTEDLRIALQRYRAFFQRLLAT